MQIQHLVVVKKVIMVIHQNKMCIHQNKISNLLINSEYSNFIR